MTRPIGPKNKVTPAAKQEPTTDIYKQGGTTSVTDALARDKNSVRAPIQPSQVKNPSDKG